MSFKCILQTYSETQSKVYGGAIFAKFIYDSLQFFSANYFCKKAPSQMFEWVLNDSGQ